MRLITQQVPMNFNIFEISCTHWGSEFHHTSGWENLVRMLKSPYKGIPASANYLIHHGDMIEAKEITNPHWSLLGSQPGGIIPQMTNSRDLIAPIKKQVITILEGNHEQLLHARYGDITAWVCNELGITYGTYSAIISFVSKRTGELLFKQFATHGHIGIKSTADDIKRRKSNLQLSLKRQLKMKAGDTLLMTKGHTHRLILSRPDPELYLYSDGAKIRQMYTDTAPNVPFIPYDLRWYVNVGAFFRMYGSDLVNHDYHKPLEGVRSSYAESGEYDPIELGFAVVMVRDGQIRDVVLEVVD